MRHKEKIITALLILIFFDIFLIREARLSGEERVVFCDVGQGDAALISLGSVQAVVDGGPSTAVLSCLGKYMPYFDRRIEYIFVSHPDKDHFLGLVEILRRYSVEQVIINGDESDLPEWQEFEKLTQGKTTVAYSDSDFEIPLRTSPLEYPTSLKLRGAGQEGGKRKRNGSAKIDFLYPDAKHPVPDGKHETNDYSLVFKFLYTPFSILPLGKGEEGGGLSILFTGDLPEKIERKLVQEKNDLAADILKVGHHGSKYSSSEEFLRAVRPKFATVSVGADNKYGHPAYIILKRLEILGVKYLRTDESGDIIINF